MATRITLALDRQNKTLVPLDGSAASLPAFYQRDVQPVLLKFVEPNGNPPGIDPYDTLTDDDLGGAPRVTFAQKATGTNDDEDTWLLARTLETDFVWSEALEGFIGDLELNTDEMATFIGSSASATVVFEVRLAVSGSFETIYQNSAVTVRANADESGTAPMSIISGAPVYNQIFLRDINDPDDPEKYLAITNVDGVFTPVLNS